MNTHTLVQEYLSTAAPQLAASTCKETERTLSKFAQACPTLPQSPEPVFRFLAGIGNTAITRQSAKKRLCPFYAWVAEHHRIRNPMPGVKIPKRKASAKRQLGEASDDARQSVNFSPLAEARTGSGTENMDVAAQLLRLERLILAGNQPKTFQIRTDEAVQAFLEELEHGAKRLKHNTVHLYYAMPLQKFAKQYKMLPMEPLALGRFVGAAPTDNQAHVYYRVLKYMYNTLARMWSWRQKGILNPADEMVYAAPDLQVVEPLQADEIERMLLVLRGEEADIRAMHLLLLTTGARPVEIGLVRTSDFFGNQIRLQGKTKVRLVSLIPQLQDLMLAQAKQPGGVVFPRLSTEKQRASDGLDTWIAKVMKKADVRHGKGGGRLFRHTLACWLYSETNDPFLVKQVLGHTQLEMSNLYADRRMGRLAKAPLWYELIKVAAAYHKMESLEPSVDLNALIKGQRVVERKPLSASYIRQYGTDEERKALKVIKPAGKSKTVQSDFLDLAGAPEGVQAPQPSRNLVSSAAR